MPVIFTTAYDQFALDAFKVYSVDYLLKPIQFEDLNNAIKKLKKISSYHSSPLNWEAIQKLISQNATNFKERFILKSGNKLSYKHASEAAYFFADGKTTYLVTKKENRKYIIDYTLDELEAVLDPKLFFRINRKFILSIGSVSEVRGLISSGMEVKLNQPCEYDLSVSRDRSQKFKAWLDKWKLFV